MSERQLPERPRISLMLRLLHQHYARDIETELARAGFADLRTGQAKVFPFVPAEGIQVGELARLAGVRKQSMAETVDQLVATGYLERRPNPNDGRSRLIFLTGRGKQVRPEATRAGDRVEAHWARLTSRAHVERLRTDLRALLDRLGDQPDDDLPM
jgi:DNA-binding MarR family transcriptional regulator